MYVEKLTWNQFNMKACLSFKRFHVRELDKAKGEMMIVVMALNTGKLVSIFFLFFYGQQKNFDENRSFSS